MASGGSESKTNYTEEMEEWKKDLKAAREQVIYIFIIFKELSFKMFLVVHVCVYLTRIRQFQGFDVPGDDPHEIVQNIVFGVSNTVRRKEMSVVSSRLFNVWLLIFRNFVV